MRRIRFGRVGRALRAAWRSDEWLCSLALGGLSFMPLYSDEVIRVLLSEHARHRGWAGAGMRDSDAADGRTLTAAENRVLAELEELLS